MDPTLPLNPRRDTFRGLADVSLDDFSVDTDALADLSFNPVEHHERLVVGTLRSDAGREYESDGFSRRTLRTIVDDLRHDGHRPGAILVPYDGTDLFDDARLQHPQENTSVEFVNFHGWGVKELKTPDVLSGEAFVIGENALLRPRHAPAQVLVRHPDAVARYTFDP
jgi:hypothetical protein